jgi:hypothetical protein
MVVALRFFFPFLCLFCLSLLQFLPSFLQNFELPLPFLVLAVSTTHRQSLHWKFLQFFTQLFPCLRHFLDPLRQPTSRSTQQIGQRPHKRLVFVGKESDSRASAVCPARSAHSVNVGKHGIGEIVVDDQVYIPEIDASSQQVSRNQNPILASIKVPNDGLALFLRFVTRKSLDSSPSLQLRPQITSYFIIELLCSLLLLHEYQHRRH